ncbi:MAG: CHAD domain-containing protein [Saprospiraceae bacterium]|nr:CHAD domain-containing protein [Saprospiraceae bacterium]
MPKSPEQSLEIETKLAVPQKYFSTLKQILTSADFSRSLQLKSVRELKIHDYYYDTKDLALQSRDACLRRRQINDLPALLTYKEALSQNKGLSIFTREEIEGPLRAELLQEILSKLNCGISVDTLSDEDSSFDLERVLNKQEMYLILQLKNDRSVFDCEVGDTLKVEFCLDKVRAKGLDQKTKFNELEIELKYGTEADFEHFVKSIRPVLPFVKASKYLSKYHGSLARLGFFDSEKNKKDRQVKTWKSHLSKIYKRFQCFFAKAMSFKNIEDLHQARVSLRQLLTLLDFLQFEHKDPTHLKRLQRLTKKIQLIQKRLGAVRDLDVLIEKIKRDTSDSSRQDNPQIFDARLLALLQKERKIARFKSLARLPQLYNRQFQSLWKQFFRDDLEILATQVQAEEKLHRLKQDFQMLFMAFQSSKKKYGLHHPKSMKKLHRIRLLCKKLRYAYKYIAFVLAYDPSTLAKQYARMQDVLGDLNDLRNFKRLHENLHTDYGALFGPFIRDNIPRIEAVIENQAILAISRLESMVQFDGSQSKAEFRHTMETTSRDDLKSLVGIGDRIEAQLNDHGIFRFEQISTMTSQDFEVLDSDGLNLKYRAQLNKWSEQAQKKLVLT